MCRVIIGTTVAYTMLDDVQETWQSEGRRLVYP